MYEPIPYQSPNIVKANGIEICYDAFGYPRHPALLMVAGLGMQLIGWDEEICRMLAERGFWVIRYDNRDVGQSTKFEDAGTPNPMNAFAGKAVAAPYLLSDMAADAIGLLDALHVEKAHILGASMGGMIAQTVAIHYAERVRSLTSIMSTTGNIDVSTPTSEGLALLTSPPAKDLEDAIEKEIAWKKATNGSAYPVDEARARERAKAIWERGIYPDGVARQLTAILASGSRQEALKTLSTPTLVIHGQEDIIVPVAGGIATAEAIPNAKLMLIYGLGHALPPETWPEVVDAIADIAKD
ncbi:MAG: alpha/beta hydrolase [Chloroflexi bacterium]|nr:MAG: alpha/beta hydrolase [Chloroflexota bacterium]